MSATLTLIADAVTTALSGASLSQTFSVGRAYVPVHELDGLATLTLTVVPTTEASKLLTRGGACSFEYGVAVGVQKYLGAGVLDDVALNALVDPLAAFVREVASLFRGGTLALSGGGKARCVATEINPTYDPAYLDQKRAFVSVVTLTFVDAA